MADSTISTPSGRRTVTAFFDTSEHASAAKADLVAAGVPASAVTLVGSGAENFHVQPEHHKGFWESLADFFMPDDDRRAYAEGLRRGGFALAVETDSGLYDRVIDILDRDGAVDFDERELEWRREGWSPTTSALGQSPIDAAYLPAEPSTAGFGASHAGEDGIAAVDEATNPDVRERIGAGTASQTAPTPTGGPQTYTNPATPADDAIIDRDDPDHLFGRRDLTHGRSRVRSYIVEGDVNR